MSMHLLRDADHNTSEIVILLLKVAIHFQLANEVRVVQEASILEYMLLFVREQDHMKPI